MSLVPFTFSELLARQRIALGMTQRSVADGLKEYGLDFSSVAVSNWETGKNPPRDPRVVYALEEVLSAPGEFTAALGLAPSPAATDRIAELERRLERVEKELQLALQHLQDGPGDS